MNEVEQEQLIEFIRRCGGTVTVGKSVNLFSLAFSLDRIELIYLA